MPTREELLRKAREIWETAARVRRLARGLSLNADHERMMRQADGLEAEASELERQAVEGNLATPSANPPVQHEQVQQQLQHESEPKPSDRKDPDPKF